MEVPKLDDLSEFLMLDVSPGDVGVVTVTARADDGAIVTMTWDEFARVVLIRWLEGDVERLRLARESAAKISIREQCGRYEFWIWSEAEGLGGQLVLDIGQRVTVTDTLLRR